MNKKMKAGFIITSLVAVSAALAMGPLDPPAGPVTSTSPSLADIESLILSQAGGLTEGPWQVAVFDSRDGLGSQNASVQIENGQPVVLHSINTFRAAAYAFDGPGSLSGQGTINSGNVVGQAVSVASLGGSDNVAFNSTLAEYNVECPNGLEIAWTYDNSSAFFVHVYYKLID